MPTPQAIADDAQQQEQHDPAVEGGSLEELHGALYWTDSWISVVNLLRSEIGLSSADIGRGADVSLATVARWLDSPDDAPVKASGRLDDLRYVVLSLIQYGMTPRLIRFWLAAKNPQLRCDPLSAIAAGRFEEVVDVAEAFAAGRSTGSRPRFDALRPAGR
jgi:hypothetical protein